jgi:hypothetical protein
MPTTTKPTPMLQPSSKEAEAPPAKANAPAIDKNPNHVVHPDHPAAFDLNFHDAPNPDTLNSSKAYRGDLAPTYLHIGKSCPTRYFFFYTTPEPPENQQRVDLGNRLGFTL